MLDNYKVLDNGVIKQEQIFQTINYDAKYCEKMWNFKDLLYKMSYLRYGYLIGSIDEEVNTILDVGYGTGDFLKVCDSQGLKAYGNDINPTIRSTFFEFVDDITTNEYDVITFFDSLEHFHNIDFVKNLKAKFIMISVPCCHYFSDDWFKNWRHLRPDEHIYHFNAVSLINFMDESGYSCIKYSNIEDGIRKNNEIYANILTGVFKKK